MNAGDTLFVLAQVALLGSDHPSGRCLDAARLLEHRLPRPLRRPAAGHLRRHRQRAHARRLPAHDRRQDRRPLAGRGRTRRRRRRRPPAVQHAYGQFGREIGVAFQLQDDLLDVWGYAAATGSGPRRPALAQVQPALRPRLRARAGRRGAPACAALRAAGPSTTPRSTRLSRSSTPSACATRASAWSTTTTRQPSQPWTPRTLRPRPAPSCGTSRQPDRPPGLVLCHHENAGLPIAAANSVPRACKHGRPHCSSMNCLGVPADVGALLAAPARSQARLSATRRPAARAPRC